MTEDIIKKLEEDQKETKRVKNRIVTLVTKVLETLNKWGKPPKKTEEKQENL